MKKLALAVALTLTGTAVLASGPSIPYDPPVTPPAPIAAYDWSGAYIGLGVTYAQGGMQNTAGGVPVLPSANGVGVGVIGGYNWQRGNTVFGGEVALDFANPEGSNDCGAGAPNVCTTRMMNHASIRGRVGYAMDRTLVFATLGYATDRRSLTHTGAAPLFSVSHRHNGPMIGIGIEHAMSSAWSVRGDLEHYFMGTQTYAVVPARADINLVRISVVRHF